MTKTEDFQELMGEFKRFKGMIKKLGYDSFEDFLEKFDGTTPTEESGKNDESGKEDNAETEKRAKDEAATQDAQIALIDDAVSEFLVTGEISTETRESLVVAFEKVGLSRLLAEAAFDQTMGVKVKEYRKLENSLKKELGGDFELAPAVIWANENMKDIGAWKDRLNKGDVNALRMVQADMETWVTENPKEAETFRDRFSDTKAIRSKEGESKSEESIESKPAIEQVQEAATVTVPGNEEPQFKTGRVMAEESKTPNAPEIKPYEDINEFDKETSAPDADTPMAIKKRKARLEASSPELQRELEFDPGSGLQTEVATLPEPGDQS